jgi:nucleotide-binding universal stress UspA family protein
MKPILLATDGSPSAQEATREALELARMLHAPLVAVAVEHVSVPTYGY